MVEGPGCKLKGIKLRKRVKGQKVIAVSGNVIEKRTNAAKALPSEFEKLIGLVLLDVKTLGKELFALFENDVCLRVHFLMAGSVRYNNEPKEFGDRNSTEPRLRLQMSKDVVGFYDSAVELRSCAESIERHDNLIDLDICSPTFDAKRALQTVMEHSERLVCDVILDQLVLPGVGNIIKNEALYDAGINPLTKVKDLNEELVAHLVKMNRDFTNIFYKCREKGTDLRKHMRVYKKQNCPECGTKITMCKVGEYERLTFFCPSCQTNTIKTNKKLAMRNSLLGWVNTSKNQVPWNCSVCTLENKPANTKCAACYTPKFTDSNERLQSSTLPFSYKSETLQDTSLAVSKSPSSVSSPSLVTSNRTWVSSPDTHANESMQDALKRPLECTPGESCKIGKYTFKRMSTSGTGSPSKASTQASTLQSPLARPKLQGINAGASPSMNNSRVQQPFRNSPNINQSEGTADKKDEDEVLCSGHKKPARKSVVEKMNENRGRVFYVCSMPQIRQCKFFMWADSHHPLCCHGKLSVIRTVMKMNANNGRQFYCCSKPKSKQCDFFEWVDKKA